MKRPKGYWNLDTLLASSKEFTTVSAWSKSDMGAYLASRKLGLFKEVTKHMLSHGESISKSKTIWTKEMCLDSAKRFTKRFDWEKEDSKAYLASKKHGWYEECVLHMQLGKKPNNYWTLDKCLAEASKYQTISEWVKSSAVSYQSAKSNDSWFEQCTSHMNRLWEKKWTDELIIGEAKKYLTKQEWARNSPQSYSAAIKRKLVKTSTSHMTISPKWFGVSTIHKILMAYDIQYEEEKTYDDCRDKRKLPFDFYLPEFNLVIEYHGTQHKRGWQGKGAEQIQRRDSIKKAYAKNNSINFLEILEWETNNIESIENLILVNLRSINKSFIGDKRELTPKEIKDSTTQSRYTTKDLIDIALQYQTRVAFKRGNASAYNFACRNKLIDEVCKHMLSKSDSQKIGLTKWTKDRVMESAKKFSSTKEWSRKEGSAYNSARKNGWLEEAKKNLQSSS